MGAMIGRYLLYAVAFFVSVLATFAAFAGSYYVPNAREYGPNPPFECMQIGNVPVSGATPFDIAGNIRGGPAGCHVTGVPQISISTSGGPFNVCLRSESVGSCTSTQGGISAVEGGDTCYESNKGSMTVGQWYSIGTLPGGMASCNPCADPEVWNSETGQCEAPECEEGQVHDDEIGVCRSECSEGEFYNYAEGVCKLICPDVGDATPWLFRGNGLPHVNGSRVSVNGCPAVMHTQCSPAGGFSSGAVCTVWAEYIEPVQETLEYQLAWAETSLGYVGGEGSEPVVGGEIEMPSEGEWIQIEGYAAASVGYVQHVCTDGVLIARLVIDGNVEDTNQIGTCAEYDQPADPASAAPQAVAAQLGDVVDAQEVQTGLLEAIVEALEELGDDIDAGFSEMMTALDGGDDETTIDDLDSPEADGLYTPEYAEGFEDAVDAISFDPGPLGDFFDDAVPSFAGIEPAECLVWNFTMPFVGAVEFEPPCFIWDTLGTFIMALSTVGAWIIIFS